MGSLKIFRRSAEKQIVKLQFYFWNSNWTWFFEIAKFSSVHFSIQLQMSSMMLLFGTPNLQWEDRRKKALRTKLNVMCVSFKSTHRFVSTPWQTCRQFCSPLPKTWSARPSLAVHPNLWFGFSPPRMLRARLIGRKLPMRQGKDQIGTSTRSLPQLNGFMGSSRCRSSMGNYRLHSILTGSNWPIWCANRALINRCLSRK